MNACMHLFSCQEYLESDQWSLNGTTMYILVLLFMDNYYSFRDHYFSRGYVEVRELMRSVS